MKFVTVNYHLNATYHVEDVALKEMIRAAVKETTGLKVLSIDLDIDIKSSGFKVSIKVKKTNEIKLQDAFLTLQSHLEDKSLLLTGAKPDNIQIIIKEF